MSIQKNQRAPNKPEIVTVTMPTTDGAFCAPVSLPGLGTLGLIDLVAVRESVGGITSFDLYIYDESIAQLGDTAPTDPPVLESRFVAYTGETIAQSDTEGFSDTPSDAGGADYWVPGVTPVEDEAGKSNLRLVVKRVASGGAGAATFIVKVQAAVAGFQSVYRVGG